MLMFKVVWWATCHSCARNSCRLVLFIYHFKLLLLIVIVFFGLLILNTNFMQSFFAGLAASGAVTSGLRLITKAAFENASSGLRKGASM